MGRYLQQYETKEHQKTPGGTKTTPRYEIKREGKSVELVKVGERNIDAEIQSHYKSVELHEVLKRYGGYENIVRMGEQNPFLAKNTGYNDVSLIPKDDREAYELKKKLQETEAKMRNAYNKWEGKDNLSYNDFIKAITNGDNEALKNAIKPKETPKEDNK